MGSGPKSGTDHDLHSEHLARDLTIVLAVKIAALTLIWLVFFRATPAVDPAQLLAPAALSHQEAR